MQAEKARTSRSVHKKRRTGSFPRKELRAVCAATGQMPSDGGKKGRGPCNPAPFLALLIVLFCSDDRTARTDDGAQRRRPQAVPSPA